MLDSQLMTTPVVDPGGKVSVCLAAEWLGNVGVKVKDEWLTATMQYLGEMATRSAIFEQFTYSNLQESYEPPMKIPEKAAKIVLTKRIVFQIVSILNVARSFYEQLREETRKEDDLSWFHGDDDQEDNEHSTHHSHSSRRFLRLSLTNGTTSLCAVEYGGFKELRENAPKGTKLMITGRVLCRKGIMLLNDSNCVILGGGIEVIEKVKTKAEQLMERLPEGNIQKIQPFLAAVKKEVQKTQMTISPYLVRLPSTVIVTNEEQSETVSNGTGVRSSLFLEPRPPLIQAPPSFPPPSLPVQRRVRDTVRQHGLPPAAAIQPIVKIEEDERNDSVVLLNDTRDEDLNTSIIECHDSSRCGRRPIIPTAPPRESSAMAAVRNSQIIPTDERSDIPTLPCVRLIPHTKGSNKLGEWRRDFPSALNHPRVNAPQQPVNTKGGPPAKHGAGTTASTRTISSYFQAPSALEDRNSSEGSVIEEKWANKKTQMVEPSTRPMHTTFDNSRVHREEAEQRRRYEEEKRRLEEEKRMDEEMRRLEERRREEMRMREEEIRRMEMERRKMEEERVHREMMRRQREEEEEEEERRRLSTVPVPLRHPSLHYVVTTPRPSSYITPPPGFVSNPFAQQQQHVEPTTYNFEDLSSFDCNGRAFQQTSPMCLFESPKRTEQSPGENAIIPYKKSRQMDQSEQQLDYSDLGSFDTINNGVYNICEYPPATNNNVQMAQHVLFGPSTSHPPSHALQPPNGPPNQMMTHFQTVAPPTPESTLQEKFLNMNVTILSEILKQRRFWMTSRVVVIMPLKCHVPKDLRAEQNQWILPLDVTDEGGEPIRCSIDNSALDKFLGFTVKHCQSLSLANNRTQLVKLKERAMRVVKSFERLDLVLTMEVSSIPNELPVVMEIRNLSDSLNIC